jgi:hypothetical protein
LLKSSFYFFFSFLFPLDEPATCLPGGKKVQEKLAARRHTAGHRDAAERLVYAIDCMHVHSSLLPRSLESSYFKMNQAIKKL